MGITIGTQYNQLAYNVSNNLGFKIFATTLTFDSSYAGSGGESFVPTADLTNDFTTVYAVLLSTRAGAAATGYLAQYNPTGAKIMILNSGTTDAVFNEAGSDNLSTLVVDCVIIGV